MELLRTLLFVPGNRQKMIDKAISLAADALVLDLEDSVAPAEKELARQTIRESLSNRVPGGPDLYVRVNGTATGLIEADLDAVVVPGLAGIMLPKAESAEQVRHVDALIARREAKVGLPEGSLKLIPIMETARGIIQAVDITGASERTVAIAFGAEDFTLDIGTTRSKEGSELFHARSAMVLAAAAHGVQALDTVFSDVADDEGLLADATLGRRLGFSGKCLIHPKQIAPVTQVYSPSPEEITYAQRIVEAFQASGSGVISLDGKMIDPPVYQRAKRVLERAGS
ncbi:MAG: CoA ester lyase [Chloroflexi bacterium]|nr:CoA ester lyase [Chloroflexota bacterium]